MRKVRYERKGEDYLSLDDSEVVETDASALCANVLETPTPIEFSVEGGEAEDHGVAEGVGLRG